MTAEEAVMDEAENGIWGELSKVRRAVSSPKREFTNQAWTQDTAPVRSDVADKALLLRAIYPGALHRDDECRWSNLLLLSCLFVVPGRSTEAGRLWPFGMQ